MSRVNNSDIVPAAIKGKRAQNSTGYFRTDRERVEWSNYNHPRIRAILNERRDSITQVIYSYATPIAWKDGNVWVIPEERHSATTSSQHQGRLWSLPNAVRIPEDASMQNYRDILRGYIRLDWRGRHRVMVKGPKSR